MLDNYRSVLFKPEAMIICIQLSPGEMYDHVISSYSQHMYYKPGRHH